MAKEVCEDGERRHHHEAATRFPYFVDEALKQAIQERKLPLICTEEIADHNRYPFRKYQLNGLTFTVNKTDSPGALPRHSTFRTKNSIGNQLFIGTPEWGFPGPPEADPSEGVYGILVYGLEDFDLTHAGIGIPRNDYSGWMHYFNLQLNKPAAPVASEEIIPKRNKPELKDEFRRSANVS